MLNNEITQVLITVYNANMYVNFNNTIAFDSLKSKLKLKLKYKCIYFNHIKTF
jgi:hypothetical protein